MNTKFLPRIYCIKIIKYSIIYKHRIDGVKMIETYLVPETLKREMLVNAVEAVRQTADVYGFKIFDPKLPIRMIRDPVVQHLNRKYQPKIFTDGRRFPLKGTLRQIVEETVNSLGYQRDNNSGQGPAQWIRNCEFEDL